MPNSNTALLNLKVWAKRWRASQNAYNQGRKSFNDLGATAIQYMDAMCEIVEATPTKQEKHENGTDHQ